MIDLYDWPTLNDLKITLFLEEAGLDYAIKPVNIGKGEQFEAAFLAISPNNRVPAIVGHAPRDGGAPFSVFESGAILRYLADKTARFGGSDARTRVVVDEWLAWQVGGLGPMTGQYGHFTVYAPEKIAYEGSAAPARRARPPSRGSRVHRRRRVQHRRHGHLSVDQPVRDGAARSRAVAEVRRCTSRSPHARQRSVPTPAAPRSARARASPSTPSNAGICSVVRHALIPAVVPAKAGIPF